MVCSSGWCGNLKRVCGMLKRVVWYFEIIVCGDDHCLAKGCTSCTSLIIIFIVLHS